MPTYVYQCTDCGIERDHFCKIAERPASLQCPEPECRGVMVQVLTPVMIQGDNIIDTPWLKEFAAQHNRKGGKHDRHGDKPIETRTDYKNYLARYDLRPTRGENLSEV